MFTSLCSTTSYTCARWTLIAGLAFVFGYFGVDKFLNPLIWIGWLPSWMDRLMGMTKDQWLQITGAIEVVIAVGLLIPQVTRWAALIAGLHLVAVLTQTGWNDIAIRDMGLLCMASALWTWPRNHEKQS